MSHFPRRAALLMLPLVWLAASCASKKGLVIADEVGVASYNEHIVACGEKIHVGAPVILWTDPEGYSAYETDLHFAAPPSSVATPPPGKLRYRPGRFVRGTDEVMVRPEIGTLDELKRELDLFVMHYDVCVTSQSCFKVLHDRRALSIHFMLDVDGTIYQTLDLRDTAWHARQANCRSVGVEIANVGAYPLTEEGSATLARHYTVDEEGPRLNLPGTPSSLGIRTPAFEPRPARSSIQRGRIHGTAYQQYDFTPEQYDSLVKLTAALCRTFPNIEPEAPRAASGEVLATNMTPEQEADFHGLVGHFHVGSHKQDPGPAFDWEVLLERVRTRMLLSR